MSLPKAPAPQPHRATAPAPNYSANEAAFRQSRAPHRPSIVECPQLSQSYSLSVCPSIPIAPSRCCRQCSGDPRPSRGLSDPGACRVPVPGAPQMIPIPGMLLAASFSAHGGGSPTGWVGPGWFLFLTLRQQPQVALSGLSTRREAETPQEPQPKPAPCEPPARLLHPDASHPTSTKQRPLGIPRHHGALLGELALVRRVNHEGEPLEPANAGAWHHSLLPSRCVLVCTAASPLHAPAPRQPLSGPGQRLAVFNPPSCPGSEMGASGDQWRAWEPPLP